MNVPSLVFLAMASAHNQGALNEWDQKIDKHGRTYYLNHRTKTTSWDIGLLVCIFFINCFSYIVPCMLTKKYMRKRVVYVNCDFRFFVFLKRANLLANYATMLHFLAQALDDAC